MTTALATVPIGNGRVRISDGDLHRAASKDIRQANHLVFESLPSVVRQIIAHRTWKAYGQSDFASYVLDETSNGLGVNNNQRLWILRCSMDVYGEHIKEWADVLAKVETLVRLEAKKGGDTVTSFNGQSLENLAKNVRDIAQISERITYLPSRGGEGHDRHIVSLRKHNPDVFRKVVNGELTVAEARRKAGYAAKQTNLGRAQSAFRMMTKRERIVFLEWLRSEKEL